MEGSRGATDLAGVQPGISVLLLLYQVTTNSRRNSTDVLSDSRVGQKSATVSLG